MTGSCRPASALSSGPTGRRLAFITEEGLLPLADCGSGSTGRLPSADLRSPASKACRPRSRSCTADSSSSSPSWKGELHRCAEGAMHALAQALLRRGADGGWQTAGIGEIALGAVGS